MTSIANRILMNADLVYLAAADRINFYNISYSNSLKLRLKCMISFAAIHSRPARCQLEILRVCDLIRFMHTKKRLATVDRHMEHFAPVSGCTFHSHALLCTASLDCRLFISLFNMLIQEVLHCLACLSHSFLTRRCRRRCFFALAKSVRQQLLYNNYKLHMYAQFPSGHVCLAHTLFRWWFDSVKMYQPQCMAFFYRLLLAFCARCFFMRVLNFFRYVFFVAKKPVHCWK